MATCSIIIRTCICSYVDRDYRRDSIEINLKNSETWQDSESVCDTKIIRCVRASDNEVIINFGLKSLWDCTHTIYGAFGGPKIDSQYSLMKLVKQYTIDQSVSTHIQLKCVLCCLT